MNRPSVTRRRFGRTLEGDEVELFTLGTGSGCEIGVSTFGATVTSIHVPDSHGVMDDVVLGFDSLEGYLGAHPFFGGTIGRFANRIARGRFHLESRDYQLACNNGVNHLHGGTRGFDRRPWSALSAASRESATVRFQRDSPDGEEGYPGRLSCEVAYTLNDANELRIDYTATTDRPTIVNLTHHSYFNLAGLRANHIREHQLFVNADAFLPVDETQIPTGETRPVAQTPFDFRHATSIDPTTRHADPQLAPAHGVDHNYVLNRTGKPGALERAARVFEPSSGRVLEVLTDQPGLQVYFGGFLDGTVVGKGGRRYERHAAFCLEAQQFPDAPNQPGFPSVRLDPGQTYRSSTVYRFSTATAAPDRQASR